MKEKLNTLAYAIVFVGIVAWIYFEAFSQSDLLHPQRRHNAPAQMGRPQR